MGSFVQPAQGIPKCFLLKVKICPSSLRNLEAVKRDRKNLRNEEIGTPASSCQSEMKIRFSDIKSSGKIRIDPQNLSDTVFKG